MFGLSKYRNMFGEPNTGVHRTRFLGVAIVDVLATLVGGVLLGLFLNFAVYRQPFHWNWILYSTASLFLLGIAFHRVFDVRTTVDRFLFSG